MDLTWVAIVLSGAAAVLAAIGAFRPRGAAERKIDEVAGQLAAARRDIEAIRTGWADEQRRGRDEADGRSRMLREEVGAQIAGGFGRFDAQSQALREEVLKAVSALGDRVSATMAQLGSGQAERLEAVVGQVRGLAEANERRLGEIRKDGEDGRTVLREEVSRQLVASAALVGQHLDQNGQALKERLDGVTGELRNLVQRNADAHESLRNTVEGRLETLRADNAAKLEQMRQTVDEKLQSTLDQRLSASFKTVSDGLEQVFKSVGEMQTLAAGVGDLKRVLTNAKSRGTWAEVALGGILDQVLAPEQFGCNVQVTPGSGERVEFAIRLPGQSDGDAPVWLPIDAKFPSEDYERLLDASERADGAGVEAALKGLEIRIRSEAQSICTKYINPPHTTDFAILYLPTEGLYAEVIRRPGLVDDIQRKCRIVVAGPTVLMAILSSLRMGFRTLAIQRRSGEVWQVLAAVKTEFERYGSVLEKVKKKLGEASDTIDKIAVRERQIERKLSGIEKLPEGEAQRMLAFGSGPELDMGPASEAAE